jgi:membrane protein implicated in regulation of membrane protease activity
MLVLHAGGIALESSTLRTFLPRFDSLETFLRLGGRPAFWLIIIASLAALFRTSLGKKWQLIHWLNYLAFLLGTVHAQMIGFNFQSLGMKIASGVLALVLVWAFIRKRTQKRGQKQTEKTIKPQEEKEVNP